MGLRGWVGRSPRSRQRNSRAAIPLVRCTRTWCAPLRYHGIIRSGVGQAGTSAESHCFVLSLAASLGLQTVAEGVEREEDYLFLRQGGATIGQGYFWCPPLPFSELADLVRSAWPGVTAPPKR